MSLSDCAKDNLTQLAEERKRREDHKRREEAKAVADKYINADGNAPAPKEPPPDTPPQTNGGGDDKINDEDIINALAALSTLDFEKRREDAAKKLGVRVSILDRLVEAARGTRAKDEEPPPDIDALRKSAAHIIESENVLDLFAVEFSHVIAGETVNGKLLYLVGTSRLLDKTMNAAIKGPSAGGKSQIRTRVLEFFPPKSIVAFTSLSEKALLYFDDDFPNKILSMGEANATDEQSFQDYLLRELMSEGRLRYPVVQKIGGNLVTTIIEKNGPVAFLVTTTRDKLHAENETRMLSLEVDDSESQTKSVLGKVAQVEGLNVKTDEAVYKPWRDFQSWLETGDRRVVVPFADRMVALIPPAAVRLRRDVGQVIRAVKAHALLHREHRNRDEQGQIIAEVRDYEAIRDLMEPILAEGSGTAIRPAVLQTINAVKLATASLDESQGATAQTIGKMLKLDKSSAWRRLSAASNEGFVVNLETRKGMAGKYRATSQALDAMTILPTGRELQAAIDTHLTQTPPETVQPCNPEGKAATDQEDGGCKDGCNPVAEACTPTTEVVAGCTPVASPFATVKPLNVREESLPVAGLQPISVGYEKGKFRCVQCNGEPDGEERQYEIEGQSVRLHPECRLHYQSKPRP